MRKTNLLDVFLKSIFILSIIFILFSNVSEFTQNAQYEYLTQAILLGSSACILTVLYLIIRLSRYFEPLFTTKRSADITEGILLLLIIGFGLFFRLRIVNSPVTQSEEYLESYQIANSMANGNLATEFPQYSERIAMFPYLAGYPMLVLTPVFKMFGVSVKSALYANLLLSLFNILLVYLIARTSLGRQGGIFSALLMSCWPAQISISNKIAAEPLLTFLCLVSVFITVSLLQQERGSLFRKHPGIGVLFIGFQGLIISLAVMVRPVMLLVMGAIFLSYLVYRRDRNVELAGTSQQILSRGWLCAIIVLIVFVISNFVIYQNIYEKIQIKPVSVFNETGFKFLVGTNQKSTGQWNQEDADFFEREYKTTGSAEAAHTASYQEAIKRIDKNPAEYLNLLFHKFTVFWLNDEIHEEQIEVDASIKESENSSPENSWFPMDQWETILYLSILMLAGIAVIRLWQIKKNVLRHLIFLLLGVTFYYMVFEVDFHYKDPFFPFLMIIASFAISLWYGDMESDNGKGKSIWGPPIEKFEHSIPEHKDYTHFNLEKAIEEGHVTVTVSEAYAVKKDEETDPENR